MLRIVLFSVLLTMAAKVHAGDASATSTNLTSVVHTGANSYSDVRKPRFRLDKSKIVIEADGSYTPRRENIVDILAALESSIGAAVNFELVFAKDSSVLTADGEETLGLIADSIRYLDSNIRVDVEMPRHTEKGRSFTERRGSEIVRLLRSRFGVKNPINFFMTPESTGNNYYSTRRAPKGTELSRLTILNMGVNQ